MGNLILEFGTIEELEEKAKIISLQSYVSKVVQNDDKFQRIVYGYEDSKFFIEIESTLVDPRLDINLFLEETRYGKRINLNIKNWNIVKNWSFEQLQEYYNNFIVMRLNPLMDVVHPELLASLAKEKEQMKTKFWIIEKENRELKTKLSNQESWIEKVKNLLRFKKYSRISSI